MRAIRSYSIFRKLEMDELVPVGTRDNLGHAQKLVESLNELWPAEYVIRPTPAEQDR